MEVSIENISPVQQELSIMVPSDEVDRALSKIYQGLRREAKLRGFRKGKAPVSLIKAHYKEYAIKEAENQLVMENYRQALMKHKIPAVSSPEIHFDGLEEGKDFLFKATVEVVPKLPEMTGYKGIPVKSRLIEVLDVDIHNAIDRMRKLQGKLEITDEDYEAQDGDYIIMDYEGMVDGKPFKDGKKVGAIHKLGSPDTLPDFDNALMGVKAKERRSFKIVYPEDFPNKDLAGKEVSYTVDVKEVKYLKLPEVDDAFIKSFGDFEDLNAFREFLRKQIEEEREGTNQQWIEEQILSFLLKRFIFEVPKSWITKQAAFLLQRYEEDQKRQGIEVEKIPLSQHPQKRVFEDLAKRQVKSMLLIDEIAKKEGITVGEDELNSQYEKISREMGVSVDQVRNYYASNDEQLNSIKDELIRAKTLAYLRENAVVELVKEDKEEENDKSDSKESVTGSEEKGRIILP